jgi:hypothetical protein
MTEGRGRSVVLIKARSPMDPTVDVGGQGHREALLRGSQNERISLVFLVFALFQISCAY